MRRVFAVVVAALLLSGCGGAGAERMDKWSSAPAPNNNPAMSGSQDPNPELKCQAACQTKADDAYAKCLNANTGDTCKDKLSKSMLECNDKCGVR